MKNDAHEKQLRKPIDNFMYIRNQIVATVSEYLLEYPNIKSLILGVSGGADSALVGLFAKDVCSRMKRIYSRDIKLIGRSLPIETNTLDEIERSELIGELVCDDFKLIDLTHGYSNLANSIGLAEEKCFDKESSSKIPIVLGNIKARVRMIYLYNLAGLHDGLVLSTDNYTEYLLGFWTLHGDVGDYGMIQNLWKTEVYGMLSYYIAENMNNEKFCNAIQPCIDALPTDGLGITQSDFEQFGDIKSYKEIDEFLFDYLYNGFSVNLIKNGGEIPKVLTLYERTHYKRNNPFNIPRHILHDKFGD